MKSIQCNVIRACLTFAAILSIISNGFSQSLTVPDESDIYIQHCLVNKGDKFLFTPKNTSPRSKGNAGYDHSIKLSEHGSLKVSYPIEDEPVFLFWLRHPMVISPYTEYRLKFKVKVKNLKNQGPYIDFAVYDESRETQVESHKYFVSQNHFDWHEEVMTIKTQNQAHYARLLIKSQPMGTCDMWIDEIMIEQISDPVALKPSLIPLLNKEKIDLTSGKSKGALVSELPENRNFFSISINLNWRDFNGTSLLEIEWMDSERSGVVLTKDKCEIRNIEGIQPQWNGIAVQWWREGYDQVDFVSRKLDKLFNQDLRGGSGQIIYKVYQPDNARYLKLSIHPDEDAKGKLMIEKIDISGEYFHQNEL